MEIWIYLRLGAASTCWCYTVVTPVPHLENWTHPQLISGRCISHRNIHTTQTKLCGGRVRAKTTWWKWVTHLRDPCFARNGRCLAICLRKMPRSCCALPRTRCSPFYFTGDLYRGQKENPMTETPLVNYLPWTWLKIPFPPWTDTPWTHKHTHATRLNDSRKIPPWTTLGYTGQCWAIESAKKKVILRLFLPLKEQRFIL